MSDIDNKKWLEKGGDRDADLGGSTQSSKSLQMLAHQPPAVQQKFLAGQMPYNEQLQMLRPPMPMGLGQIQRKAGDGSEANTAAVHAAAAKGVEGSGGTLPHLGKIQASFGAHDVSNVQAHVGGAAAEASASLGAQAYATGNKVAFKESPSLHTTAHEAAHVVQQRAGVSLDGGVGKVGDSYERHADQVADAVVQGRSAEALLGGSSGGDSQAVQREASGGGAHEWSPGVFGTVQAKMSNADYAAWKESVQCKAAGPHGSCAFGDHHTMVTQFSASDDALQMISLAGAKKWLGDRKAKAKAVLVVGEGVLTLAAGVAVTAASSGFAAVPGVLTAIVGVSKIVRGCLMYHLAANPSPDYGGINAAVDLLRGIEAILAGVAGALSGNPVKMVAGIVFAIAKLVRSIAAAVANTTKDAGMKAKARKVAAVAHAFEVVAGGISAGTGLVSGESAKIVAGAAGATTAVSKAVRTGMDAKDAHEAAKKANEEETKKNKK